MKFYLHPKLKQFKRRTAVILPKDIGAIIALNGLSKWEDVVEIGGGSGYLTFYLARIAKHIYVYERRPEIYEILKQNLSEFDNVTIKNEDGKNATEHASLYVIDSPDVLDILPKIKDNTNRITLYMPNANQAQAAAIWFKTNNWNVNVVRVILEEWEMDEKRIRPKHKQLYHTAYLVFGNRMKI